jgi:hypothetical protein
MRYDCPRWQAHEYVTMMSDPLTLIEWEVLDPYTQKWHQELERLIMMYSKKRTLNRFLKANYYAGEPIHDAMLDD